MATDSQSRALITPDLAHRIAELRACENVRELRIVTLDDRGHRALILLVPHAEDGFTGGGWQQPGEPFLMLVDAEVLAAGRVLN